MAVNITLKDIYSKFLHISNKIFTFCIKYVNNLEPGFIQCSETEQGAPTTYNIIYKTVLFNKMGLQ